MKLFKKDNAEVTRKGITIKDTNIKDNGLKEKGVSFNTRIKLILVLLSIILTIVPVVFLYFYWMPVFINVAWPLGFVSLSQILIILFFL